MGNELLASKVVIAEEPPKQRSVPVLPTSVCLFVGVTERGPFGATQVSSWGEYLRKFGGFISDSYLPLAVYGFFLNGGTNAWISRTVHYTSVDTPATKTSAAATRTLLTDNNAASAGSVTGSAVEPFDLEPGDTLVASVDGGGTDTATFTATAAAMESGNGGPFALVDQQTLTLKIDNGDEQTIEFLATEFDNIATATAEEVAAVINAKIVGARAVVTNDTYVTIQSDRRGTSSIVDVTGGTAAALGFATEGQEEGTGNVPDIDAVTVDDIKTVVEDPSGIAGVTVSSSSGRVKITSDTTGADSSVQIDSSSTADDELGLDNAVHSGSDAGAVATLRLDGKTDGTYAHDLHPLREAASSGNADEFNLSIVTSAGVTLEKFVNLKIGSANADDPQYCETVVNDEDTGSDYVTVTDLLADVPSPNNLPVLGAGGVLASGSDGLASLADADYVGSSAGKTGIYAGDLVDDLTLLCVPGIGTSAVHNGMCSYCAVARGGQVFAILDPPANQSATAIITYTKTTAALKGLTELAAMYWPRVEVGNPSPSIYGSDKTITVPPSGHIAGMFARTDGARPGGVYDPPAGVETGVLFGVLGVETTEALDEGKRDLVFPERINPICKLPDSPYYVDGARCLKSDGNWPTVAQRRGVSHIEQSIKRSMQVFRHKRRDDDLLAEEKRTVDQFLVVQTGLSAFVTKDPKLAFYTDFGKALNPSSKPNITTGRVGLATAQPNEFVVLMFSQDTTAYDNATS